jgi:hypothetical protein
MAMRITIFVTLLLALSSQIYAAPSVSTVSGTVSHGQSVTVSGAAFGTHADYNSISDTWQGNDFLNFRFKDFEDNVMESDGLVTNFDDSRAVATPGAHAGTYYGNLYYGTAEERIQLTVDNINSTGTWWASFWFMMPADTQSGKFFRIYMGADSSRDNFYLSTGCSDRMLRGANEAGGATVYGSPNQFGVGTWHRVDVLATASTGNLNVTTWMDGAQQWAKTNWGPNLIYSPDGHSFMANERIDAVGASRCAAHPTWDGAYNYDDIYFSYTQARVEICSGSTWAAKGTCEIQIPQTWADTTAVITVNQGAFADSSTNYLYVVDSAGVASNAEEITFGAGAPDTTPPTVTSASVNGTTVTVNFDEAVVTTGYDAADFNIDCSTAGTDISLTSPTGTGASRTFTAASSVAAGDTCNLDYVGGADDIEDAVGNDLATFSDTSVTVNTADVAAPITTISTSDPSTIVPDSLSATGTASDAVGVSGCKWRIGFAPDDTHGTSCTGTTSFTCATTGYASGANTLHVACYDAAGNYGDDSITVNYDPPATCHTGRSISGMSLQ